MRDKLIAAFSDIYWKPNNQRAKPMTHEMADAALEILKAAKK